MRCTRRLVVLLCECYICNYWVYRKYTRLCEPLWSIRLNCQLMTKFEMMRILQAQVY